MSFDKQTYRQRHVVEQCVGWLKECRRIGTRFEKLAVHFHGMIQLAMIRRYLKLLFSDRASVERRLVEQSENYIRRRQILSTAETIYVAREMPSTTHYDQKRRYPYRSVAILGFHNAVTIVIFAIGIVVGGCNKYGTEDLTANPSYGFGGAVGVWKTKTPLWVANVQGRMCLMATDQIAGSSILETVPAGTEIRIEHLIMKRTFETDFIAPYGCVLSGPQAGKTWNWTEGCFT